MSEPEIETGDETEPDVTGPSDDEATADEEGEDGVPEGVNPQTGEIAPVAIEPEGPEDRKRQRAAQQAVKAYATKITQLFSDQAEHLLGCPLCGETQWPGFVSVLAAGHVPDDVKNATMQFLGYAIEIEYREDGLHHVCTTCAGYGKIKTGSRVAAHDTITCGACKGYGYTPAPGAPGNGVVSTEHVPAPPEFEPAGAGVPDVDPSGEPRLLPDGRENPNYGKWPQYKVPVAPWGVTVGLTVQDAVGA